MNSNFLKISALVLTIMAGLFACSKDKDVDKDQSQDKGKDNFYFTAKIDGDSFSGDLSSSASFGAFKYHDGSLTISVAKDIASPGTGTFMLNILSGYTGAGSYTVGTGGSESNYARYSLGSMGTGDLNFWAAETGNASTANTIGTGTIVVTSDANGIVEGTFQFDGYNNNDQSAKHITEGKFRLKVQ